MSFPVALFRVFRVPERDAFAITKMRGTLMATSAGESMIVLQKRGERMISWGVQKVEAAQMKEANSETAKQNKRKSNASWEYRARLACNCGCCTITRNPMVHVQPTLPSPPQAPPCNGRAALPSECPAFGRSQLLGEA